MGYFSRLAATLWADDIAPAVDVPIEPRRPVHWEGIIAAARGLAPRVVQLSATTWAVPSGSNPTHGYVVTGPADMPAHGADIDAYRCTCPWCQPQGPDDRPGVGCKHVVAVIGRRLGLGQSADRAA